MGLDQFARTMNSKPEFPVDFEMPDNEQTEEIMYWRKHPDLQGWMKMLYEEKGGKDPAFNCNTVQLDLKDLDRLEKDIINKELPKTSGFFFGESYGDEDAQDLEFVQKARAAIRQGKTVYYSSWW